MRLIARPASGACLTDPCSIREVLDHLEVPSRLPRGRLLALRPGGQ
jgi:hypothetical protein